MSDSLESMMDCVVSVVTNDGRNIVGVLKGFDQTVNVIMDDSHMRVYSKATGVEKISLGLYIVRGDNIAVIGEVDEELDARIDFAEVKADPLKAIVQHVF